MSETTHFPKLDINNLPDQICFTFKGKLYELYWTNMPMFGKIPCCSNCPLRDECIDADEDADPSTYKTDGEKLSRFCSDANELLDDFYNEIGFISIIDLEAHPEANNPPFHNRI